MSSSSRSSMSLDSRRLSRSSTRGSGGSGRFQRSYTLEAQTNEQEALMWAAIERLPTFDRLRTSIVGFEEVDVANLGLENKRHILDTILRVAEEDNERVLLRFRNRLDRVGLVLPNIEVRFESLSVVAPVHAQNRVLPTLINFAMNQLESFLGVIRLASSKKKLNILNDLTGIIRPSRMTLLLGPPSSGKTTLLLALSGRLNKDLKVKGSVSYNGQGLETFVPQRTFAYISQDDIHIGEMTVRETFDFATRCQGVGSKYEMLSELSRRERDAGIQPDSEMDAYMKASAVEGQKTSIVTDYVLKILGLEVCADTFVGDNMRRGISGGQKKRVTTGEMLVGPAKALFMDEISTGLDSSTTFQIVKYLRQTVHVMDGTMLVSLLQPAPETFDLFDDVILISDGYIVYQGPREHIVEFFEMIGFRCPERKGVADFLQEVTSKKDQQLYWVKNEPYEYLTARTLSEAFKRSHAGQRLAVELSNPFDKSNSHPAALVVNKYFLRGWELYKACLSREWLLLKRNSFLYIFKAVQISFVAIVTMTVFIRTEMPSNSVADANKFLNVLFFGILNVTFNGLAEMAMTIMKLPMFYKQRDILFYPAWAYALPTIILKIPISLLESAIWIVLTYWVVGFAPEAERFFKQFLLLFSLHHMSLGLFRMIGALSRTMVIANTFGSFAILLMCTLGGFLLSKDKVQTWLLWGYWTSPLTYAQNALSVNEFFAERWQKPSLNSTDTIGILLLKSRGIFAEEYWYWIGVGSQFGMSIIFNAIFILALTYLHPFGKNRTVVSDEETKDSLTRMEAISTDVHSHAALAPAGMVLPFQPLSIVFDHINYYVDMPPAMTQQGVVEKRLQLLHDVSGAFRPNILTALVGVSGAGKTTLMDVLAGRKTGGFIEGSITISGHPKKQETFARISGYCEQNDIHSPNITVRESITYSAWLRLSKEVDSKTRKMFVEQVMELIELTPLQNSLVGLPGIDGLSTEQRKRLTIAVELVANPSIIFMDEPTSGLDARAAAIVMRAVRNTVSTGRTVVCTIHQPSIDIFETFHELLLMKRGGEVIYAGPLGLQSCELVQYLEAIDGVPKLREGINPATWMLEVSSESMELQLGVDFAQVYQSSALYKSNIQLVKDLSIPAPGSKQLYFSTPFAQTFVQQCLACLWKQQWSYWRNPQYSAVRIFFTVFVSLMIGAIFWNLGSKRETQQDIFNVCSILYISVLFIGVNNASAVIPVVDVERTVYYREKAAGMYSQLPYAIAQVVVEVPYITTQTLIYGLVVYSMVNMEWSAAKFMWFIFFLFFSFWYFTLYGMMILALSRNAQFAAVISSLFYTMWNLFSGFLIPYPQIPIWWKWYYWCSPISWTLYGIIASQLGDVTKQITIPDEASIAVKDFVNNYFGYSEDLVGVMAALHVGFVVLCVLVFAFCIKHFNFQQR